MFFVRRIPYEEESLLEYFPDDYPAYRAKTWIGIPFVPTVPLSSSSTVTTTVTTTTTTVADPNSSSKDSNDKSD